MSNTLSSSPWSTLPNPFLRSKVAQPLLYDGDAPEIVSGYVSGRVPDILEIIDKRQSAFILQGAPHIGKSTLIKYLQSPSPEWSWRDEVLALQPNEIAQADIHLDSIHFVQIDLSLLETRLIENLSVYFEQECVRKIHEVYQSNRKAFPIELKTGGLRELIREITKQQPNARYFVMLDTIERLGRLGVQLLGEEVEQQVPRDRGLAILAQANILAKLVELNEEFPTFGAILSVDTLPSPDIHHQFSHVHPNVSPYLARFEPITLKTLTLESAQQFLQQGPESCGSSWAKRFHASHAKYIFSQEEQIWLLEQAGTHLYLLQHFCFRAFKIKQRELDVQGKWPSLGENSKIYVVEKVNEQLSTFFMDLWNRLQEAFASSSQPQEIRNKFRSFLIASEPNKMINTKMWDQLGSKIRYILKNEGTVCFDQFERVHYPGAILLDYLRQKVLDDKNYSVLSTASPLKGFWLTITCPGSTPKQLSLSEREYGIMYTLLQHTEPCTQETLMIGAWGRIIDRPAFTQRIYHLRRKLKDGCNQTDVIKNSYGGSYLLHHPEWFHLE
jgi:Transcriptional regulatory protein, C terminal